MEKNKRIILVTMFYDLYRIENNTNRRNCEEYFEYGKHILNYDLPMVIYTDDYSLPKIEEMTSHRSENTIIVPTNFENLPYFKYKDRAKECWNNNKPVFPNKLTYTYSLLMWCKPYFMYNTVKLCRNISNDNFSEINRYCWIDFGINHFVKGKLYMDENKKEIFNYPITDKLRFMSVRYFQRTAPTVKMYHDTYCYVTDHMIGSIFTGSEEYIIKLYINFEKQIQIALNRGYCPTDEPIYEILLSTYPEDFSIYYGNHSSIILNYYHAVEDADYMIEYFGHAYNATDWAVAYDIGIFIYNSWITGYLKLNSKELFYLLDNLFVVSFYRNGRDHKITTMVARKFIETIISLKCIDIDFFQHCVKNKSRLLLNFTYLPKDISNEIIESVNKIL